MTQQSRDDIRLWHVLVSIPLCLIGLPFVLPALVFVWIVSLFDRNA